MALHYVYNTPFDRLIWDVGHQAYPHKILTGRRDKIGTIRQKGGLHPFPWRGESEYDVLSVGHLHFHFRGYRGGYRRRERG